MGQNCAGPERFIVHTRVYDDFCLRVGALVDKMTVGDPLSSNLVDCGACCVPSSMIRYQKLVDDAVGRGARVLCGGVQGDERRGRFYPPTVSSLDFRGFSHHIS